MIISTSKKFIFIHNPKTAGFSFEAALEEYVRPDFCLALNRALRSKHSSIPTCFETQRGKMRHLSLQNICKLHHLGIIDISDYFIFGFVRNPWDRFASAYHYIIGSTKRKWRRGRIRKGDINRFARRLNCQKQWAIATLRRPPFDPQIHYFEQDILPDLRYKPLIGYYERLDEYTEYISRMIGIPIQLPHINKSANTDYISQLSEKTKELIGKWYSRDVETFGYTFDTHPIHNRGLLKLCDHKKILIVGNARVDWTGKSLDDYTVVRINRYHREHEGGTNRCDIWAVNSSLIKSARVREWEAIGYKHLITAGGSVVRTLRRRKPQEAYKIHPWPTSKQRASAAIDCPVISASAGTRAIAAFLGLDVTIAGFDFFKTRSRYSKPRRKHHFGWERQYVRKLIEDRKISVMEGTCNI